MYDIELVISFPCQIHRVKVIWLSSFWILLDFPQSLTVSDHRRKVWGKQIRIRKRSASIRHLQREKKNVSHQRWWLIERSSCCTSNHWSCSWHLRDRTKRTTEIRSFLSSFHSRPNTTKKRISLIVRMDCNDRLSDDEWLVWSMEQ